MSTREEKREQRKGEMLEVAMRIVVDEGVDALTISNLAGRLNISVGAIYRYFDGKDALMGGLERLAIDSLCETLREDQAVVASWLEAHAEVAPSVASLLRCLTFFGTYTRYRLRAPERHRLIDAVMSDPSPLLDGSELDAVNESLAPMLHGCAAALDAASEASVLTPGDATLRTHLLWAAVHGLDHFRKRDRIQPESLRFSALSFAMLRTLFVGWGAEPGDVEEALTIDAGLPWCMEQAAPGGGSA